MATANTLDTETLKMFIKESVREVMREEWFKFFALLPYIDDEILMTKSRLRLRQPFTCKLYR